MGEGNKILDAVDSLSRIHDKQIFMALAVNGMLDNEEWRLSNNPGAYYIFEDIAKEIKAVEKSLQTEIKPAKVEA
jgi:hypothetical protein